MKKANKNKQKKIEKEIKQLQKELISLNKSLRLTEDTLRKILLYTIKYSGGPEIESLKKKLKKLESEKINKYSILKKIIAIILNIKCSPILDLQLNEVRQLLQTEELIEFLYGSYKAEKKCIQRYNY